MLPPVDNGDIAGYTLTVELLSRRDCSCTHNNEIALCIIQRQVEVGNSARKLTSKISPFRKSIA